MCERAGYCGASTGTVADIALDKSYLLACADEMVAPSYAAARSQLAKQMGLGQQPRRRAK